MIIIGTGAGGGTLAHVLARSGKRIVLAGDGREWPLGNIQMVGITSGWPRTHLLQRLA